MPQVDVDKAFATVRRYLFQQQESGLMQMISDYQEAILEVRNMSQEINVHTRMKAREVLLRQLMELRKQEGLHNRSEASRHASTDHLYWLGRIEQCNEVLSLLDGKIDTVPTWDEYRASR